MKIRAAVAAFLLLTTCAHAGVFRHRHYVPVIGFDDDVNDLSVGMTIDAMAAATRAGAEAIIIEFNTPGGSVDAGFHLSKAIENSPIPVICVVDGEAASMGTYLLESCSTRIMTKRSYLMFHQPGIRGNIGGSKEEFQNIADLLRALETGMVEHLVARMNITAEDMLKKIEGGKQWWMNWREALKIEAIDCAVDSVKEVSDSYRDGMTAPRSCR